MVSRPGGNKKRDREMATHTGREYLGCDQTHRHGPGDKWLDSVRNTLPKKEGEKRANMPQCDPVGKCTVTHSEQSR